MTYDIGRYLICEQGDITTLDVDVIVNAANKELIPGGGVDGAINRAAGPKLGEAMKELGGCETGNSCITFGYNLKAGHVVHAVGPIYGRYTPQEANRLLRNAYRSAFSLAAAAIVPQPKTIAAPLLSTGVYGYPMAEACRIAVEEAYAFLQRFAGITVTLVAFDEKAFHVLFNEGKQVWFDMQSKKSDNLPKVVSPHS